MICFRWAAMCPIHSTGVCALQSQTWSSGMFAYWLWLGGGHSITWQKFVKYSCIIVQKAQTLFLPGQNICFLYEGSAQRWKAFPVKVKQRQFPRGFQDLLNRGSPNMLWDWWLLVHKIKNIIEVSLMYLLSLSNSYFYLLIFAFTKTQPKLCVLNFGWPLDRVKDNRRSPSLGGWKGGCGHLLGASFTVFYWNNFWTSNDNWSPNDNIISWWVNIDLISSWFETVFV